MSAPTNSEPGTPDEHVEFPPFRRSLLGYDPSAVDGWVVETSLELRSLRERMLGQRANPYPESQGTGAHHRAPVNVPLSAPIATPSAMTIEEPEPGHATEELETAGRRGEKAARAWDTRAEADRILGDAGMAAERSRAEAARLLASYASEAERTLSTSASLGATETKAWGDPVNEQVGEVVNRSFETAAEAAQDARQRAAMADLVTQCSLLVNEARETAAEITRGAVREVELTLALVSRQTVHLLEAAELEAERTKAEASEAARTVNLASAQAAEQVRIMANQYATEVTERTERECRQAEVVSAARRRTEEATIESLREVQDRLLRDLRATQVFIENIFEQVTAPETPEQFPTEQDDGPPRVETSSQGELGRPDGSPEHEVR